MAGAADGGGGGAGGGRDGEKRITCGCKNHLWQQNFFFYFFFYFYFNLESETGYYRSEPIIVHIHKGPNLGPINFLRF